MSVVSQRVVDLGFFKGFKVSPDVSLSLLQYTDESLVGEY
jgi:hypothetical protein